MIQSNLISFMAGVVGFILFNEILMGIYDVKFSFDWMALITSTIALTYYTIKLLEWDKI